MIQSHNFLHPGRITCCSTPNSRPPATKALHTICGNNTSIVSSSWWWAYKCLKHVEQIIIVIKPSVASSWFSSLRLYYNAGTNIHQIYWNYLDRKTKNNEKCVRAAILGLGLPFMEVNLLLWQLSESNMRVTGHFSNLTEITSTWTQFLSWMYSKASFKFTILWRWKKSACYYNLPACMTELNPFHINFQEWCHTCVFCVGICSASAILL